MDASVIYIFAGACILVPRETAEALARPELKIRATIDQPFQGSVLETSVHRMEARLADELPYPYWSCMARLMILSETISDYEMISVIGLEPDDRWTKGLVSRPLRRPAKTSAVIYQSGEPTNVPAYNHVEAVLAKVRPVAERIAELARTARSPVDLDDVPDPWISLILLMFAGPYDENIRVRSHQIQELARMGAGFELAISFDTGNYYPDPFGTDSTD